MFICIKTMNKKTLHFHLIFYFFSWFVRAMFYSLKLNPEIWQRYT